MSIVIKCPGCGKDYKLRDELGGKRVKCKCGHAMVVPAPAAAEESDTYDLAPMGDSGASSLLDSDLPVAGGTTLRGAPKPPVSPHCQNGQC